MLNMQTPQTTVLLNASVKPSDLLEPKSFQSIQLNPYIQSKNLDGLALPEGSPMDTLEKPNLFPSASVGYLLQYPIKKQPPASDKLVMNTHYIIFLALGIKALRGMTAEEEKDAGPFISET